MYKYSFGKTEVVSHDKADGFLYNGRIFTKERSR